MTTGVLSSKATGGMLMNPAPGRPTPDPPPAFSLFPPAFEPALAFSLLPPAFEPALALLPPAFSFTAPRPGALPVPWAPDAASGSGDPVPGTIGPEPVGGGVLVSSTGGVPVPV